MYQDISIGKIRFFDEQTSEISAATKFSQLVSLPYLDTTAGSNPREFTGITPTNEEILKGVLKNQELFWSYHSGIIITLLDTRLNEVIFNEETGRSGTIFYEDACLTNGLQTISILRILLIIKIYQEVNKREVIHTKITNKMIIPLTESLEKRLGKDISTFLLDTIGLKQINKVVYWLNKDENKEYYNIINSIGSSKLLEIRIGFRAIRLESIIEQYKEKFDTEVFGDDVSKKLGYEIATSNNSYQMVKEDDKFGTVHREWLDTNIMCKIKSDVDIIYRMNSKGNDEKNIKKHILDLLRALIPTTLIINNEKFENMNQLPALVSAYTSYRLPIYKLFENYINKCNNNINDVRLNHSKKVIENLMPDLVHIMCRFEAILKEYYKNELTFEKICDLLSYGMDKDKENLKIRLQCDKDENDENELNRAVKKSLSFSPSVLFAIFVYATHDLINIDNDLNVSYKIEDNNMKKIIERCIYKEVLNARITRQYGSTSDLFRDHRIYSSAKSNVELINDRNDSAISAFRVNLTEL